MQVKFLHTSMAGSYYQDCEILAWDVPYTENLWPTLNQALGKPPENAGEIGAVIKYYDDISEEWETRWIKKDRIKTPPIYEWLGM